MLIGCGAHVVCAEISWGVQEVCTKLGCGVHLVYAKILMSWGVHVVCA